MFFTNRADAIHYRNMHTAEFRAKLRVVKCRRVSAELETWGEVTDGWTVVIR